MKKIKVAIIGGGASGLVCAIKLAKFCDVVVFEKNDRVGKKILQTGNGRCNFCNLDLCEQNYNNPKFVKSVFKKVDKNKILTFFKDLGLCFYADEQGRMYPISNQASSVLDVLRMECKRAGVTIKTNCEVKNVSQKGGKFEILGEFFDKAVVATGNIPNEFVKALGHSKTQIKQGLCSLKVDHNEVSGLAGIRAKVSLRLESHGECFEESGEIQFKNQSLGGICIFNLSSIFSRKNLKNARIFVDFAPNINENELSDLISNRINRLKNEQIENVFVGMFHKALGLFFLKRANIESQTFCKDVSTQQINKLVETVKNCCIKVLGTDGEGQVRVGGIKLEEVDDNLMSKITPNLYFVGECLDIDGLCGGYNLAWAWASGLLACNSISKEKNILLRAES